jgi:magnesium chelatase family protein
MIARRLPSVLPPLTTAEALEVTRIHSIAGLAPGSGLIRRRPFRAPHHTISASGLVGGGAVPVPGEVSLAHQGVLFLDELSEFPRSSLEALRQPIEDGRVAIVRGQRLAVFPTRLMLVAATNPCPCGFRGFPRCRCTEADVARYERRLSGPLLDRIDVFISVQSPSGRQLAEDEEAISSREVRDRVLEARERQQHRLAATGATCNAQLGVAQLRRSVRLDPDAERMLRLAYDRGHISARGHHRVLRVARTVADLAGRDRVAAEDVLTAVGFRRQEAELDQAA